MTRLLWQSLMIVCLAAVSSTLFAQPARQPPDTPSLADDDRRLFEQLDSGNFADRQRAEQALYDRGATLIPALETAALSGRTSILPPVLRVLERMLIEGCPDVADAAERALERLAFSEVPETMARARVVLSGNHHLRQRRAVAAIRELGGRVIFESLERSQRGNAMWGWGQDPPFVIPGQPPVWMRVFLLRGWRGGAEGLWHLSRLEDAWSARLWGMEITAVRGSGLPIESVQALAARIPQLQVHERGASLGVTSGPLGDCRINEVIPGGAAAHAGLKSGDIVIKLNETPITNFSDLVGNLLNHAPEETVTLTIKRGGESGEELEVPVVLGDWQDLSIAERNRPPAPAPLLPRLNQR